MRHRRSTTATPAPLHQLHNDYTTSSVVLVCCQTGGPLTAEDRSTWQYTDGAPTSRFLPTAGQERRGALTWVGVSKPSSARALQSHPSVYVKQQLLQLHFSIDATTTQRPPLCWCAVRLADPSLPRTVRLGSTLTVRQHPVPAHCRTGTAECIDLGGCFEAQ